MSILKKPAPIAKGESTNLPDGRHLVIVEDSVIQGIIDAAGYNLVDADHYREFRRCLAEFRGKVAWVHGEADKRVLYES